MTRRNALLNEMGFGPVWALRDKAPATQGTPAIEEAPQFDEVPPLDDIPDYFMDSVPFDDDKEKPVLVDVSSMGWDQLEKTIEQCTACGLCQGRTQAVPGVGDRNADWLFVGEGPGFFEDQQGEPFVGASGKLLDNMLQAIDLKRGENAYIANVVKCRATDTGGKDRAPTPGEAAFCKPYLERQIALIQPKIIVALGRVASTTLLGTDSQTPLATLRGKEHSYRMSDGAEIPLIATYHPAYLLRQLSEKRKAWADLCLAMNVLSTDASEFD
jgi:uracil-DNA glycosylase